MSGIQPSLRIGIDLGGSKIEAVAMDAQGAIVRRHRVPTPRDDYPATLQAIAGLVTQLETELQTRAQVGIGMPGTLSPATGLVKNSNSTWVNDRSLDRDLEALLQRPLRFANDANCFALSEAKDGSGANAEVVFGVIIGTGVGGGVVVNGHLLQGPNGIAGEWGHNPLPWPQAEELPGPVCYCGGHGCIETWLSGPGLARDHHQHTDVPLDAVAISAAAAAGDPQALASLQRYQVRMARALAAMINSLDPHVIVLGGGLSKLTSLYEQVPKLWGDYVFSDRVDTRLVLPRHGDSSGVRGAAWLWDA